MATLPASFGKYTLLEKIATGGMAEIWKAKFSGVGGFEKYLVIKSILPHLAEDKEFVDMFFDEAKISVMLQHSNIAQIWEMGQIKDEYFIALEYIAGKNLREIVKKCKSKGLHLSVEQTTYIIAETCKGLEFAHQKRTLPDIGHPIIHRDISPQNIMVSYEGEVKIVDFGIAKARGVAEGKTQAGVLKGKFGYMSPEQARGQDVDHRSDIFATGIVLWELLTGQRLFLGESDFDTLERVKTMEIKYPSVFNPMVERELNIITLTALERDLNRRYQSAGEMQADLSRFLNIYHADFTPMKLSSFLKTIFEEDIQHQHVLHERQRRHEVDLENAPTQRADGMIDLENAETIQSRLPGSPDVDLDIDKLLLDEASAVNLITGSNIKYRAEESYHLFKKKNGLVGTLRPSQVRSIVLGVAMLAALVMLFLGLKTIMDKGDKRKIFDQYQKEVQSTQAAVKPTMGYVNIDTIPRGAKVFIDPVEGDTEPNGYSPLSYVELTAKPHLLRILKEGYRPFEQEIQVTVSTLDSPLDFKFTLEKELRYGKIVVTSSPDGATIYLNSTNTGFRTPYTFDQLEAPQQVTVRLEKDGYRNAEKTVALKPEIEEVLDFRLYPRVGRLCIRSDPEGAEIYLDEDLAGKTPLDFPDIYPGREYRLRLSKKGYQDRSGVISIDNPDLPKTVNWTLKKLPPSFGLLIVQAKPWATVYINGKAVDETPTKPIRLQSGKYTLKLSHPQYPPKEMEVFIQADKTLTQIIDMTQ